MTTPDPGTFHAAPKDGAAFSLHADAEGLPCFACFFMTVHTAVPPDLLQALAASAAAGGEAPDEYRDRLSASFGYLVTGIADTLVHLYEDPEQMLETITAMLRSCVAFNQVEQEDRGR